MYFVMILDTCNSSVAVDIDGTEKRFTALSVTKFQAEIISTLATSCFKLIKAMDGVYVLSSKI